MYKATLKEDACFTADGEGPAYIEIRDGGHIQTIETDVEILSREEAVIFLGWIKACIRIRANKFPEDFDYYTGSINRFHDAVIVNGRYTLCEFFKEEYSSILSVMTVVKCV